MMFPRLFRIVVSKESFVSDCFEGRNGCTMWGVFFGWALRPLEGGSYEELLSILTNVFIYRDSKDSRIWKPSISREFSTKNILLGLGGESFSKGSFCQCLVGINSSKG